MPIHLNHTMGRVLARAWSDTPFKARLLAGPRAALAEIGVELSNEPTVVARENTARTIHLVISAPPIAQPISAHSEIRDFAETYRDPRLWSLNWIGRDPPASARLVANPLVELGKLGVRPPKGLGVIVTANTAAVSYLILPPRPPAPLHAPPVRAAVRGPRAGELAPRSVARQRTLRQSDRHVGGRGEPCLKRKRSFTATSTAPRCWPTSPVRNRRPLPLVLSVHGGRWYYGTRRDTGAIDVRQWAEFGFVAMSIDYRLVTCTPAPACYQDMLCAIRWVHANADTIASIPDRIFLIGMSAGGHMAALAATLGEGKFPKSGGWDDYPMISARRSRCRALRSREARLGRGLGTGGRAIPHRARVRVTPASRPRGRAAAASCCTPMTILRSPSSRCCAWMRRSPTQARAPSSSAIAIGATCSSRRRIIAQARKFIAAQQAISRAATRARKSAQ